MDDIGDVVNTANETKRVNDKISATLEIQAQLVVPPEVNISLCFRFSTKYSFFKIAS